MERVTYLPDLPELPDLLSTSSSSYESTVVAVLSDKEPRKQAVDLFLPLSTRLNALVAYYQEEGDQVGELISCIVGMSTFSRTKCLREYVTAMVADQRLPLVYRLESAKQIDEDSRFDIVQSFFEREASEMRLLSTPIRLSAVIFLMQSDRHRQPSLESFCEIILDQQIELSFRFRSIQTLEHHIADRRERFLFYAGESAWRFFLEEPNSAYRVIAAQYMFEVCEPSDDRKAELDRSLLVIVDDVELAEDVRADACDVLLQYGSDETRVTARTALFVLGGGDRVRNNIFRNAQNVHVRSIEESVEKIVNYLSGYYPSRVEVYTDFDLVKTEILEIFPEEDATSDTDEKTDATPKKTDEKNSVEGALLRISIDRAVYGHSNMTLVTLLCKLWTYIQDSEHTTELHRRLIEELTESNNKCSTGYASRLVNTLSGFDEKMSVTISYEDEIVANVEARLNSAIQKIESEDIRAEIVEEMTIPVIMYHLRGTFLKFFREHISKIREEMYQEYRTHMTDIDYDFYFRKAIIHYEGCY